MGALVSVLIPSYNHEDFLEDCLNSLMAQTWDNIELIVIDDKSTDSSWQILKRWEEKLKNRFTAVILERNEKNLGVCKTCNRLIQKCHGKYTLSLASDDALLEDGIEKFVNYYEKNQDCAAVFSNVLLMNEEDHYPFEGRKGYAAVYTEKPEEGSNLRGRLFQQCYIVAGGACIKKETFDRYGTYREDLLFEDWEFWLRISGEGRIGYLDDYTLFYRENPHSLSHYYPADEWGRRNAAAYINTKKEIIRLYRDKVQPEAYRENGVRNVAHFSIYTSLAVEDMNMVKENVRYALENGIEIPNAAKLRIFLLKIHLLPVIHRLSLWRLKRRK